MSLVISYRHHTLDHKSTINRTRYVIRIESLHYIPRIAWILFAYRSVVRFFLALTIHSCQFITLDMPKRRNIDHHKKNKTLKNTQESINVDTNSGGYIQAALTFLGIALANNNEMDSKTMENTIESPKVKIKKREFQPKQKIIQRNSPRHQHHRGKDRKAINQPR
jgi:hypothetical protein